MISLVLLALHVMAYKMKVDSVRKDGRCSWNGVLEGIFVDLLNQESPTKSIYEIFQLQNNVIRD